MLILFPAYCLPFFFFPALSSFLIEQRFSALKSECHQAGRAENPDPFTRACPMIT